MKVGVLGAGSWGTAMARLIAEKNRVYLWDVQNEVLEDIDEHGRNEKYLPGIELPESLKPESELSEVLARAELLVIAVPSHAFREVLGRVGESVSSFNYVVNLAKGFDPETGRRMSQVYRDQAGNLDCYYQLSGPSHATEVGRRRPTTVTLGGGTEEGRKWLQEFLFREYFRVYVHADLVGIEMGGALKNIIALAAGVADGLGFGVNARAALITRGMNDLREVADYEGGDNRTLYGLSGLGDLIVTATSELSRNFRCGQYLARGLSVDEAREKIGQVVEGINSTRIAMGRIEAGDLRAPLFRAIYHVVEGEVSPREAVDELMTRRASEEFGHVD